MSSCVESFGNKVDGTISGFFARVGTFVGHRPRLTILLALGITVACGGGFVTWETENRPDKLWVPQDTTAEQETEQYESYFPSSSRFNTMIVQASNDNSDNNVLTMDILSNVMRMHNEIATRSSEPVDGETYTLVDLCTKAGGACISSFENECQCLMTSILRQWNYDLETLQNDTDIMKTLNQYGSREDLEAIMGGTVFDDENEQLVSAGALTLSYFLQDRTVVTDGNEEDPINEQWEGDVFLEVVQTVVPENYPNLSVDYLSARSFSDEFGEAISGDLVLVQVSYVVAFFFLGATLGRVKCGTGSRWTMALGALFMVGLSTAAGFGMSSLMGLFFGPVHSLLPFVLLGIGVDDAFVIVNAFNRERKVPRVSEANETLAVRSSKALSRAGASITVTSLTDLVAFAISSSTALPALSSFCAYAAISIFFLWLFASTFFTACLVLDERRQRDNRRECVCCITRRKDMEEDMEDATAEGPLSRFFRNYHGPAILSIPGKAIILIVFAGLLAFGFYGAMNLSVEDSERNFVPADSYLNDYIDAADTYFPSQGIDLYITFHGGESIYEDRVALANLDTERLTGLSTAPPYISEPVSEEAYRNVMTGLYDYLVENGSDEIGGVTLGDDNWPTTEADFITTLSQYASFTGPGSKYAQDVSFSGDNNDSLDAFRIQLEYVKLTKKVGGEVIDDAEKQIDAMDATRDMIDSWTDLQPAFPYSDKFITIEGFKIIRRELFLNVGMAIAAVGVIVFITVASPMTSILITLNVAFCIVEILGFMYATGVVIDSVSVINIVLAVGLSVDYSAHIGHCFMVKQGGDKNQRVIESLADIGAAVLSGGVSTFLAVAVLLFSSSYVFEILSRQFALTVGLGLLHGLVLLPVLLALFGPAPFSSAEHHDMDDDDDDYKRNGTTSHGGDNSSDE